MQAIVRWTAAAFTAVTFAFAASAAYAQFSPGQEARATGSVNVRTGPGTGFVVVDTLQRNELVTVQQCRSNWCYIDRAGADGWVSANYLAAIGGGDVFPRPQPQPQPQPQPTPPPSSGGFNRDAVASVALNVRSGPGTNYGVVDTLTRGERVRVGECRSGWCLIRSQDGTGWASERYLAAAGSGGGGGGGQSGPDIGFTISGPNFSFTIGAGSDFGNRPVRPEDRGSACFYEHANYGGRSVCARPGESYATLGSFNDVISSIRIQGNIEVQVCEESNFRGRCAVLTSSQPRLPDQVDDVISSLRVR